MPRTIAVPEELQAIIDTHRALFGGFVMEAPETPESGESAPEPKAESGPEGPADKELGPAGERALAAVRDENKQLRQELTGFKDALTQALGIEPSGDKKADALDLIRGEVAALRRENAVQRVARTHGIAEESDIALLMRVSDEDMADFAARLKPLPAEAPKPDPAIDPALGKTNQGGRLSGVQQYSDDWRARNAKKKTPQP